MRYLTARCPELKRIILVESGSRRVIEGLVIKLRGSIGSHLQFDLVTCYPGAPAALDSSSRIWRTQDYTAPKSRAQLLNELTSTGATVLAIVCSNEDIMTRWKWWLAWKLPAKVLIVNENSDAFWLDVASRKTLLRFIAARAGFGGELAGRTIMRIFMLPFVFVYLLLWASIVHARRFARTSIFHRHI